MSKQYMSDVYTALANVLKTAHANGMLKPSQQRNYDNFLEKVEMLEIKKWQIFCAYLINHDLQEMISSQIFDYFATNTFINDTLFEYWIKLQDNKNKSLVYANQIEPNVISFFSSVLKIEERPILRYKHIQELELLFHTNLRTKGYIKWQNLVTKSK